MAKTSKIQKKEFFEVTSNLTAAKISLYAASPEELNGKIVRIDLTRNLRGKSLELRLKVKSENGKLVGESVGLELAGSYIRRAFRKGADYVEDSFVAECKDGKATVKPFMLTRNKVSRAVRAALRDVAREYLITYLKTRTMREVFTDIMVNKIQKEISLKLKKIYPLALCEIRVFEVIDGEVAAHHSEKKIASEAKAENLLKNEQIGADAKRESRKGKAESSEEKKE